MLPERLRTILRGHSAAAPPAVNGQRIPDSSAQPPGPAPDSVYARHSHGLEQFFAYIKDYSGLSILDLGETNQANINFITSLGHKLYSENFLRSLDASFNGEAEAGQSHPAEIENFLRQNLDYGEAQLDGVLVWDVLQYMAPPLLAATLNRLYHIVKPGSYLLAIFNAQERLTPRPVYTFKIHDDATLLLADRGLRPPVQTFNNRTLEKLFQRFDSLKFFLTREQLREVIVKR